MTEDQAASSNYRERLHKAWADFMNGRFCIGSQEFLAFQSPVPKHGDTWGDWEYDAKAMVLTYRPEDYEVDLQSCTSLAATADWIFQIAGKVWGTPEVLGNLAQAFQDLLQPQSNLRRERFNVAAHLKALGKKPRVGKRGETKPN